MESVKKSILDNLNEKIASPLIGGFIISWIIWNYKTVLILLSTKSVEDKFAYIENIIYKDWWSMPLYGILLPLSTAIVVIILLPRPERLIHRYWHQHKKSLNDDKQEIDAERLLSKKESRELIRKIIEIEDEHNKEIDKKDFEIIELKKIITENEKNSFKYETTEESEKKYRTDQEIRELVDKEERKSELKKINRAIENERNETKANEIILEAMKKNNEGLGSLNPKLDLSKAFKTSNIGLGNLNPNMSFSEAMKKNNEGLGSLNPNDYPIIGID